MSSRTAEPDVWGLQRRLGRRLLVWSGLSVVVGVALLFQANPFWRGFGLQAVVWGAVDALIAQGGWWVTRSRLRREPSPYAAHVQRAERWRLRRLLVVNAGLDVLYVAIGAAIIGLFGERGAFALGNGWGVVVQGGFLLLFDGYHAWQLRA